MTGGGRLELGGDGGGEEVKRRVTLLRAGLYDRPDPFAPPLADRAARALRDPPMDGHEANRLFGQIVGRLDVWLADETEVTVQIVGESIRHVARFARPRQLHDGVGDEPVANGDERSPETFARGERIASMNRGEQLSQMREQRLAIPPVGAAGMLDQKLHVADPTRQTELYADVEVLHVLAVRAEIVAAQQAVELLAQHVDEHVRAARRVDAVERKQFAAKAPRPQPPAAIRMARLVDVQSRLAGQRVQQLFVTRTQAAANFLHQLRQLPAADTVVEELADRRERSMHGPLRYATSAVSRGPTRPAFTTSAGNGAWCSFRHAPHQYARPRYSSTRIGHSRISTC